jgi:hypothetical protein
LQISVHAADVKTVLRVYAIEVAAEKKEDLIEDPIVKRLRKVRPRRWPLSSGLLDASSNSYLSPFRPAGQATMVSNFSSNFRARMSVVLLESRSAGIVIVIYPSHSQIPHSISTALIVVQLFAYTSLRVERFTKHQV